MGGSGRGEEGTRGYACATCTHTPRPATAVQLKIAANGALKKYFQRQITSNPLLIEVNFLAVLACAEEG